MSCQEAEESTRIEVPVYATFAAQPWLKGLYQCAGEQSIILTINAVSPQISLRLGEPEDALFPIYKVAVEEIIVAVSNLSEIQNLSDQEVRALFAKADPLRQIIVYSEGEDIQTEFDERILQGVSVTSSARLAATPEEMSALLSENTLAVGILPGSYLTGSLKPLYSVGTVPVIAQTVEDPTPEAMALISCLQLSVR